MIETILACIYLILSIVPFSFLRYYPFLKNLRFSLRTVCLLYTGVVLLELLVMVLMRYYGLWSSDIYSAYRFFFAIAFGVLSFWLIKADFFKQFFVYTMTVTYVIFVCGNAHFFEFLGIVYWEEAPDLLVANIVIILQLLLTYPLVFRFLKNRVIPLLTLDSPVWKYIWTLPSMFVVGMISYYILVKIMEQTRQNTVLQEKIRTSQEVLEMQRQHYQLLTNRIQEARAIRHDFHHHLLAMQAYLDGKQYEQLTDYLSLYAREFSSPSQAPLCRHYLADAVLQHYQSQANEQGCEFRTYVDIPPQLSISDLDLCIVLGNLLENALEGNRRLPPDEQMLHLHLKRQGEMLILTLDNRFDGSLHYREGTLLSHKRGGAVEGIGLQSVRAIAEKYQGVLRIEPNANVFKVSVMLTLPSNEN